MRIAIVHVSIHHKNTERIAEAMAGAIGAELLTISQARELEFPGWDVLGLGSGIFFGKHHRQLLEFAEQSREIPNECFVFSSAGIRFLYPLWHRPLVRVLQKRGCRILGQFCSPGWDTVGPLQYLGGIHRGRPNAKDLERAARFAKSMIQQSRVD
jgi:flavodoxin